MNCGREENPTYHIFILLGASVSFLIQKIVWENLTQSDYGILLGYSKSSKSFRVYNSKTIVVEEAIHIRFDGKKKLDEELSKINESFTDLWLDDSTTVTSSSRQ